MYIGDFRIGSKAQANSPGIRLFQGIPIKEMGWDKGTLIRQPVFTSGHPKTGSALPAGAEGISFISATGNPEGELTAEIPEELLRELEGRAFRPPAPVGMAVKPPRRSGRRTRLVTRIQDPQDEYRMKISDLCSKLKSEDEPGRKAAKEALAKEAKAPKYPRIFDEVIAECAKTTPAMAAIQDERAKEQQKPVSKNTETTVGDLKATPDWGPIKVQEKNNWGPSVKAKIVTPGTMAKDYDRLRIYQLKRGIALKN